jgi:uncharacterized DUF497 family protein
MSTEFEWNPIKAASNLQKHGVSFVEAATIFFDPLSSTVLIQSIRSMSSALQLRDCLINVVSSLWSTPIAVIESES